VSIVHIYRSLRNYRISLEISCCHYIQNCVVGTSRPPYPRLRPHCRPPPAHAGGCHCFSSPFSPPSSRPQIMSRRATPGQAAQNQQTIKSLLKLETNKICADCKRNKRQCPPPMPLTRAWYRGFWSHCILTYLFLRPAMGVLELGYLYLHSVLGYPSGNGHTH
jgi:hypothetical protein